MDDVQCLLIVKQEEIDQSTMNILMIFYVHKGGADPIKRINPLLFVEIGKSIMVNIVVIFIVNRDS